MVSEKSSDELPPGWKEHVKVSNGRKIKYYTNEVTGLKFYSKIRVIRFVNNKEVCHQSVNEHEQKSSCSKSEASPSQVVVDKNESPEWLPQGWIVESRHRTNGGSVYKIYIDPSTGSKFYSKPQVMKYLERVNCNAAPDKQQKDVSEDNSSKQDSGKSQISGKGDNGMGKEVSGDNSSKQDTPQHCESTKGKSLISGKEEDGMGQLSMEIVSCEVNGDNYSKQDTPQHCEPMKSSISGKEENGMDKPSLEIISSVVDESDVLDDFPPGWIKEIRARKRGTRKDPYYIDPVSGYEFRSKKDALRYLEFGDISHCAITPKKRDDQKLVETDVSAQTNGKKGGQEQAGRQTFVGHMSEEDGGNFLTTPVTASEAERSRETKIDNISTDAKVSNSTVVVQDMDLCSEEITCGRSGESLQPKTECSKPEEKAIYDNGSVSRTNNTVLHEQKQPEAERSKKRPSSNTSTDAKGTPSTVDLSDVLRICSELNRDISADSSQPKIECSEVDGKDDDTEALSNTATVVLHEQKHPQDYLDTQTHIQLKKSKKRKPPSMPARSSKRLSGQKPEILPELGLSERALRAAVRKPCQTEAYISSNLAQNSAANGVPQQFDTQLQREVIADLTSPSKVASIETEMQNNIEKPSKNQVVQEQAVGQVNERREGENTRSQDSQFWYQFGDSFSDPCYEFAFKTLTGEIPFEDALAFPGCSFTLGDASFGPLEVGAPALFQNDVPFHFDTVQQNISTDQVPPKSTIPPGNVNLPSCSSFGSQQPSLESRSKDYETKVNS